MCACTYTLTPRHKKKFNLQILLSDNYKNYKIYVNCQTKVRHHTGMHPACMQVNTCTYIPQHTSTLIQLNRYTQKYINLWLLAETSTFGILYGRNVRGRNVLAEMSVAEMSVAEISYIRTFWGSARMSIPKMSIPIMCIPKMSIPIMSTVPKCLFPLCLLCQNVYSQNVYYLIGIKSKLLKK